MYRYYFIIIIIILYILYILNIEEINNINIEEINNKFEYYIIHLERSTDRMPNIQEQIKKINNNVTIFTGIDGNTINFDTLLEENRIDKCYWNKIKKPSVYGCYMSHYKLIETIKYNYNNKLINTDYSIIFEDDFVINVDNLDNYINEILTNLNNLNIDFDIIYLGNSYNTHGNVLINNIYNFNNSHMYGEAYLLNNKNIDKIYNNLYLIDEAIDWKFRILIKEEKLNAFMIHPTLINQLSLDNTVTSLLA